MFVQFIKIIKKDFFLLFFLLYQLVAPSLIGSTRSKNLRATIKKSFLVPGQMIISPILHGRLSQLPRALKINNGNKSRPPAIVLCSGMKQHISAPAQWSLHRQGNI